MNLIFDFDGTICDSWDTLLSIINPVLKKLRKGEITKDEIREKGARQLFKEKNIPSVTLPFIIIYGRLKLSKTIPLQKPFVGIPKIIQELSEVNTLGIVTSNSKSNVAKFLENNNLENHFTFIYTSINYFNKSARLKGAIEKYKLKTKDTVFIGDETRDMQSAKIAGIKTIGVTWGIENKKLLLKARPDYLITKPKELIKIINK